jgi:hypothetical protein
MQFWCQCYNRLYVAIPTTSIHWSLGRWPKLKKTAHIINKLTPKRDIWYQSKGFCPLLVACHRHLIHPKNECSELFWTSLAPVNTRDLKCFTTEYVSRSAISSVTNHHIFLVLGILAVDFNRSTSLESILSDWTLSVSLQDEDGCACETGVGRSVWNSTKRCTY